VIPDPKTDRMSDEDTTARAAELAELIVDEVSESDQNWHTIEWCAQELSELAAQVLQRATVLADSPPDR
jgi:type II secretory pathway predicted ATPase ExeA